MDTTLEAKPLISTSERAAKPTLSVVVCVYNEEENIAPLVDSIYSSLNAIDFELIYVDDGSRDKTVENIKNTLRPGMKLIELQKNYGQSSALAAGIDHAEGEFVVLMDGDLQNDPSDIPMMLDKVIKDDLDVLAGIRANRKDGFILRKIPSYFANKLIGRMTGIDIKDAGCTLKVIRSTIAKRIGLYGELHRFIPLLTHLEGATIDQIEVKHHPRVSGDSKYGLSRTYKVLSDLILMVFFQRYLAKPMHLFGGIGLLLTMTGIGINLYLLGLKILGQDIWGKPLLILGLITFFSGLQFLTTGIVVEILMRVYYEGQEKKPYSLRRVTTAETSKS